MKRIALGIATLSLVGCVILALLWWSILAVRRPPFDVRLGALLLVIAIIQVTSWVAVLRLWMQARSIPSVGFAVHVGVLGLALLVSHLANGFTPALGAPLALVVLLIAVLSLFLARPSRAAPRVP